MKLSVIHDRFIFVHNILVFVNIHFQVWCPTVIKDDIVIATARPFARHRDQGCSNVQSVRYSPVQSNIKKKKKKRVC